MSYKTFLLEGWSLCKEQTPRLRTKCFGAANSAEAILS